MYAECRSPRVLELLEQPTDTRGFRRPLRSIIKLACVCACVNITQRSKDGDEDITFTLVEIATMADPACQKCSGKGTILTQAGYELLEFLHVHGATVPE